MGYLDGYTSSIYPLVGLPAYEKLLGLGYATPPLGGYNRDAYAGCVASIEDVDSGGGVFWILDYDAEGYPTRLRSRQSSEYGPTLFSWEEGRPVSSLSVFAPDAPTGECEAGTSTTVDVEASGYKYSYDEFGRAHVESVVAPTMPGEGRFTCGDTGYWVFESAPIAEPWWSGADLVADGNGGSVPILPGDYPSKLDGHYGPLGDDSGGISFDVVVPKKNVIEISNLVNLGYYDGPITIDAGEGTVEQYLSDDPNGCSPLRKVVEMDGLLWTSTHLTYMGCASSTSRRDNEFDPAGRLTRVLVGECEEDGCTTPLTSEEVFIEDEWAIAYACDN